jgi:ABC-type multidrug transport system permease subunit
MSTVERKPDPGEPEETEQAKLARNMAELLQELRVAQTGVQILFAFLLSVTFQARFGSATTLQRTTFVVTVLLTTLSAVLLITPVAWHRLYFRQGRRLDIIQWGNRFALLGLALLAMAMSGAVLLATSQVVGSVAAIVIGACALVVFATFWLVLPLSKKDRGR